MFCVLYSTQSSRLFINTIKRLMTGVYLLLAATLLTACATSKMELSKTQLQSINLTGVDVQYTKNASIWWGNAEREYAKKKGVSEENQDAYDKLINSPETKKHLRTKLAGKIKSIIMRDVSPFFRGNRPVRLKVTVEGFTIPSAAQRILIGGSPTIKTKTILVDARSGKKLGSLDRGDAGFAGNGWAGVLIDQALPDLEDRVLDRYASNVKEWLSGEGGTGLF